MPGASDFARAPAPRASRRERFSIFSRAMAPGRSSAGVAPQKETIVDSRPAVVRAAVEDQVDAPGEIFAPHAPPSPG